MSDNQFGVCLSDNCEEAREMPTATEMAKNLASTAKDILSGVIKGEAVTVSDEEREARLTICKSCEFFEHEKSRCFKCGCFMETKTKFAQAHCPIHKW